MSQTPMKTLTEHDHDFDGDKLEVDTRAGGEVVEDAHKRENEGQHGPNRGQNLDILEQ